jgi:hypothetical protein
MLEESSGNYIIFTPSKLHDEMLRLLKKKNINAKQVLIQGKGEHLEGGFLVNYDYSHELKDLTHKQTPVYLLTEGDSSNRGKRKVYQIYDFDNTDVEDKYLGYLSVTTQAEALQQDWWCLDLHTEQFYILT